MVLGLEKLSRKALAAGAVGAKKTSGKGWANKPAASALPLKLRNDCKISASLRIVYPEHVHSLICRDDKNVAGLAPV